MSQNTPLLTIEDNDRLHRYNLVYLRLALASVKDGNPARARELVTTFEQAETVRKDERHRLWYTMTPPHSPHEERERKLKEEIAGLAEMLRRQGAGR